MWATPRRRDQTPRITPKGAETGTHPRTKPFGPQTQAPWLAYPSHCLQATSHLGQKSYGQQHGLQSSHHSTCGPVETLPSRLDVLPCV